MIATRRLLLGATLAAPFIRRAAAQGEALPPILFVHGNGDHAALWQTILWRFESNGVPRERLRAVNMPDPLARDDDAVPQPHRSSSAEQTERLAAFVEELRTATGAPRVALIANSRGGYPVRDLVVHRGAARLVSHAILCGTPNRGVYDWPEIRNREFNSRSDFLQRLNGGTTDVAEGTAFATIRSDSQDLFAQPRAVWNAADRTRPTGTDVDGAELRGATNIVLPGLDHREVAYHARAFVEQWRFLTGRQPERIAVVPEARPVLDGLVTGLVGTQPTNRPVAGATVEIFRTDSDTGERLGEAIHRRTTGEDGRWGPATVEPHWMLEFVLAAPGHPVAHIVRSPFPRSSSVLHLRPPAPLAEADRAAGALVRFTRPRGYFGRPRDAIILDGQEPQDVRPGIPVGALAATSLPAARIGTPVAALFNEERVVARAVPVAENCVAIAELTW
ncbi:MAG TPA: hydrolase [Acetobacteraceae bacterium]|nr:hydrolase [Acetobacteraceae bacterium]